MNDTTLKSLLPGRWAFVALAVSVLITVALLVRGPAFVNPPDLLFTMIRVAVLAGFAVLIQRRIGLSQPFWRQAALLLAGGAFLDAAWMAIRLLNHTTMTVSLPMVDEMLAGWDMALGLDWPAYYRLVEASPALSQMMAWSYFSLTYLSVAVYVGLALASDPRRSLFFLETFAVTAVFCTLAGALFPAVGSVAFHIGTGADFSAFPQRPGLYFLKALERLREGEPVYLNLSKLPGLVTFPSFHTAAGILMIMALRGSRLILPVALYSALMIAATPIYGGHYFVDLIAGTATALVVALLCQRQARFRGLFDRPQPLILLWRGAFHP